MCNSTYRLGSGVTNYLHGSENVKSDSTFHLAKANTSSAPLDCYYASNPYGKVPNGSKAPPLFHKTILYLFAVFGKFPNVLEIILAIVKISCVFVNYKFWYKMSLQQYKCLKYSCGKYDLHTKHLLFLLICRLCEWGSKQGGM